MEGKAILKKPLKTNKQVVIIGCHIYSAAYMTALKEERSAGKHKQVPAR